MEKSDLIGIGIDEETAGKVIEMSEKMRLGYEEEIRKMKEESMITDILRDSGAKNIKAARALLNPEGLSEEEIWANVESLKGNRETRFLFNTGERSYEPAYSSDKLPNGAKDSYEGRLRAAREKRDTVAAIKIKQEAASKGIVLM